MTDVSRAGRWTLALVLGATQAVWASWMLAATVLKMAEFGAYEFVRHYTNWSWLLQMLFYFGSIGAPLLLTDLLNVNSCAGEFTLHVLVFGFFPLNGVVWSVLVLVSVMLATKAELFADVLAEIAPTWVMLGDSVYHFWPVLVILVYFIAYRRVLYVALNRVFARQRLYDSSVRLSIFVLLQAFVGTLLSMLFYGMLFDPQKVYKTDVPPGLGVLVVLLTLLVVNLFPLVLILFVYKVGRRVEYPRHWLAVNESDPALWARASDESVIVKQI